MRPNNFIFVSSDHRTHSQNDSCSVIWSEANFSPATLCRLVKSGFFLGERDFSSLLIVRNVTLVPDVDKSCTSLRVVFGSVSIFRKYLEEVLRGAPYLILFEHFYTL